MEVYNLIFIIQQIYLDVKFFQKLPLTLRSFYAKVML